MAGNTQEFLNSIKNGTAILKLYQENLAILQDEQVMLADGIGRVVRIQKKFQEDVEGVIEQITYLENQNSKLNKSFGITSGRAAKLGAEFRTIAADTSRSTDAIFGYADGLKTLTGGLIASTKMDAGFRKNLIASRAVMQGNLGVTAEQAEGFEKYAASMKLTSAELLLSLDEKGANGNATSFIDSLADSTGLENTAVLKTIIEDISGLSSSVRKNFSKIPGNLETAVFKAKALGVSLEEIQKIGKGLLSIESSVGEELNYQQLTGQRILDSQGNSITNQYRIAYLQKDAVKQADLLLEAVQGQADALDNPMALEQFAKTFNTSEDQVADILTQIELAKQMGAEGILKLKNPAEISKAMAEAQQAYIEKAGDDPERKKEAAAQFAELSKKFFASKDKDTRTTHEAAVEDNLSIMAAGINKMAGGPADQAALVKRAREASDALNEKTNEAAEAYVGKKQAKELGRMGAENNANIVGRSTQEVADATISATAKQVDIQTQNTTLGTGKQTNMKQENEVKAAVPVNDALIIPDRGPIIRPAANDVIAAFRPGDVIDRTLNQTTPTLAPASLDISALANAIAIAISRVKVEATIKQDTFLGNTNMNSARMFT